MPKLTEKLALQIAKELWTWLAEDGERANKADWPGWKKYEEYGSPKFKAYPMLGSWFNANCPFCELVAQKQGGSSFSDCSDCLYYKTFDTLCINGPFGIWAHTEPWEIKRRRITAREFLAELDKIKVEG